MAADLDAVVREELAGLLAVVEQWAGPGEAPPQDPGGPEAAAPGGPPEPVAGGTVAARDGTVAARERAVAETVTSGGTPAPFAAPAGRPALPAAAAGLGAEPTGGVHWRGRLPGRAAAGRAGTGPAPGVGAARRDAAAGVAPETATGTPVPGRTALAGAAVPPDVSAALPTPPAAAPDVDGLREAPPVPAGTGVRAPPAGVAPWQVSAELSSGVVRRHPPGIPAPGHARALDDDAGAEALGAAPPTPSAPHAEVAADAPPAPVPPGPDPVGWAPPIGVDPAGIRSAPRQAAGPDDDLGERLADCIEAALVEAGIDLS